MKLYDISQEVFSCKVYPGDPSPSMEAVMRISEDTLYNLSTFSMCAHNGTHVDSPFHFFADGRTIEEIPLEQFVGMAYVTAHAGEVSAEDAALMLQKARLVGNGCEQRILIKGDAVVTLEAAQVFADAGIVLLGNESQSVGPEHAPMAVHKVLLGQNVVLLEGIRLQEVPEGAYLLNAAPLQLAGLDGAPCRAILITL